MDHHARPPRRLLGIALTLAGAGALPAAAFAQATPRPPNLTPFPASNVSLVTNSVAGTTTLRFATTSWNNGTGPLELVAGPIEHR